MILVIISSLNLVYQKKFVRLINTCSDGTQSKMGIWNCLSSCFTIASTLSPLLFNFALEYTIRNVQETRLGLDMNGTHQVLAYADDVK